MKTTTTIYAIEIQRWGATARKYLATERGARKQFEIDCLMGGSLRLLRVEVHMEPVEMLRRWANNEEFKDLRTRDTVLETVR